MLSLSDNNQTDIIEAFKSTSRYLDELLNIDNPYLQQMVSDQIYPKDLQLKQANSFDTEAPFLILVLKYFISHFLMEMFLSPLPKVNILPNSYQNRAENALHGHQSSSIIT